MLPPPEGYHNIIPENTEGYGGEKPPANCIKGIDWLHYQSVPLVFLWPKIWNIRRIYVILPVVKQ